MGGALVRYKRPRLESLLCHCLMLKINVPFARLENNSLPFPVSVFLIQDSMAPPGPSSKATHAGITDRLLL